jgi:glycosyltransferase involved in cell wall biosynthesis
MKNSDKETVHITYLGEAGFPYGFAAIQRQLLIARGLVDAGADIMIISNKGVFTTKDAQTLPPPQGTFKGVPYIYTSGSVIRPDSFFTRNLLKIKGLIQEVLLISRQRKNLKLDVAIVATMRFQQIIYYYFLSRLLGFKILLNYVEHNSAIKTRTRWKDTVNDLLIDRWALHCAHAILPISSYLENRVAIQTPGKPYLKIPILSDPSDHWPDRSIAVTNSFLYCGSATYIELIVFIVESFSLVPQEDKQLNLVVSGDPAEMESFYFFIENHPLRSHINTYTRIPQKQLYQLYVDNKALLIPLRNTTQDIARFPHKIAEYLASGSPIITTEFGEASIYFKDLDTALVAKDYTPALFAEKMTFALDHPDISAEIGRRGKALAGKEFAYKKHGEALLSFIKAMR